MPNTEVFRIDVYAWCHHCGAQVLTHGIELDPRGEGCMNVFVSECIYCEEKVINIAEERGYQQAEEDIAKYRDEHG